MARAINTSAFNASARLVSRLAASAARAAVLLLVAGAAPVASAQFVQNDIYLGSMLLPAAGTPCGRPGVVHINTASWTSTLVGYAGQNFTGRMAYDPSRNALVLLNSDSTLDTMSSNGVLEPMPGPGANSLNCFTPTGDGRVYFWGIATHEVRYYDSSNTIHTLMDISGTAPFHYPIVADAMAYDAPTHSLFFSSRTIEDYTQVTKVPLNAAGTAVAGASTVTTFDASPGQNSETCVGFSKGPGGKLFMAIDDNGGGDIGRMQTVDPVTMQAQVFATSNYQGVGAEVAGVYDAANGLAMMYDPYNSKLRGYAQGGHGEGNSVTVSGIVGPCFAGAASQMVFIDAPAVLTADIGGPGGLPGHDGQLDNNDFIVFISWFFSSDSRADRGAAGGVAGADGLFDNNDFIVFINQFFAGH